MPVRSSQVLKTVMAVCALTMLDGMGNEVTAVGGVLFLVLALVLAWLSTHVADRGDHILGTILTVGAHASLIGLGGHESYGGGPPSVDTPEQQTPQNSQENKPEEGQPGSERADGEGTGEGTAGAGADLLLNIQSKKPQRYPSEEEEDEEDEYEEEEEETDEEGDKVLKLSPMISTASITVRLKFLNDTEEIAVLNPQDTVGLLKRFVSPEENHRTLR